MIKCPNCGASHYSEGPSKRTAVYYPPIWKDGININPDRNETTTEAHCCECHYDFVIKSCGDKVWTEKIKFNPSKPPIDINITSVPDAYAPSVWAPIENKTSVATINVETGEAVREQYQWEIDIKELQEQVKELKNEINTLRQVLVATIEALR